MREKLSPAQVKVWGAACGVLGLLVMFGVRYFTNGGEGRAAGVCTIAMVFASRAFWRAHNQPWFRITISILVLAHVLLIIYVPWGSQTIPAPALGVAGLVDFLICIGVLTSIEKIVTPSSQAVSLN